MEWPDAKGTYVLLAMASCGQRLRVGRLGGFDIPPGWHVYVGSAHGSGGLRARLRHHLRRVAPPHWHIDYLLRITRLIEVWYACADRRLESEWVEMLEGSSLFRVSVPGFGASDDRRRGASHLFFAPRKPSFRWFADQVRARFSEEVIRWEQPCPDDHVALD